MRRSFTLAAMLMFACSAKSFAHPPEADGQHDDHHHVDQAKVHAWTNVKTGEVVRGAFLAARVVDGVVRVSIEREMGDVVVFPLAELAEADRAEAQRQIDEVKATNERLAARAAVQPSEKWEAGGDTPAQTKHAPATEPPPQAAPFNAFAPFVRTRWDNRWLYVESDGLPHLPGSKPETFIYSHTPMVGITAWQQQVPLPQTYRGSNAWQIPLRPEFADTPVSAKEYLFRGAIALAANGVPIFNPIKNDGKTDTFLAGELDEYGGHCGRADDYHYHIAPTHLQGYVGVGQPIAYALDGFPIYGVFDPEVKRSGPEADRCCPLGGTEKLDELNGHRGAPTKGPGPDGNSTVTVPGMYHYHASVKYPYLNGGMRGVVTVKDDQIDPQPRARSPRAALPPLRGAKITGFRATGLETEPAWSLKYLLGEKEHFVNYRLTNSEWVFDFVDPSGTTKTDTYDAVSPQRRQGENGGGRRGDGAGKPRRAGADGGGDQPRRKEQPRPEPTTSDDAAQDQVPEPAQADAPTGFRLTSADVTEGRLSIECTCDGVSRSPALAWGEPPAGTKAFAAVMHHVPPDGSAHVYMVVANIPANVRELKGGDVRVGTWGQNTVNRKNAYAPPCSQGPGDKSYTITLYALSSKAKLANPLTRDALLTAIKDTTLAAVPLEVKYARGRNDGQQGGEKPRGDGRNAPLQNPERRQGRQGERDDAAAQPNDDQRGLLARMTAFKTEVPAYDMSVILARPTLHSVTVSLATASAAEVIVEYWPAHSDAKARTTPAIVRGGAGDVVNVELTGLEPGTEYHYRVGLSREGARSPAWGEESRFCTAPLRGTPAGFTFVMQADSHLDQGVEPKVYEQTLANMLASDPDFMIDLGDTFMTDKRGQDFKSAITQYDAQRYYFSRVAHAVPLFTVLGNHDGEKGTSGTGHDDIGPWSFMQRTSRFPPPVIDGSMYTGSTGIKDGIGSNYYAFEWGESLFIVLDPYWGTTERIRGGGGKHSNEEPLKPTDSSWASTLGRTQYDWLAQTLERTEAKYRFVFIHHLVGGMGGAESRGGVESSPFFEWGGQNADGTPGLADHRPGWAMPIHDLLVKHRVSAVFHGHDHLYVNSQRDGVVYQCVPQPGNPRGNTRTAAQYGYTSGTLHGSPGHLRVRIASDMATVEFVRTALEEGSDARPRDRRAAESNASVVHRYTIMPVKEQ